MLALMICIATALVDEMLPRISLISGHQFRTTMTAPQKTRQKRLAPAGRAGDNGSLAVAVMRNHFLVLLVLLPANIRFVVVCNQDIPILLWPNDTLF